MNAISELLKKVSPLSSGVVGITVKGMIGQYTTKQESDELYRGIVPAIKAYVSMGKTLASPELKGLVDLLESAAPIGARAYNFKKRYLNNVSTLRELPDDPDKLSYAHWW